MYIEKTGDPNGQPVVFLHGSLVSGWMWTDVTARLPEFRCIVPDFPGVHRSNQEPWISLDNTARQVADVIQELDRPVHVVGLSLGAIIGLHILNQIPDHIGRAVLSGPLATPITPMLRRIQQIVLWLYSRPTTVSLVARILQIPAEDRGALLEIARNTPRETNERILEEIGRQPLPQPLNKLDIPTLAITGARDMKITRDSVGEITTLLGDSSAYLAPGLGHQWSAEDPELFSEVVRAWLLDQPLPENLVRIR